MNIDGESLPIQISDVARLNAARLRKVVRSQIDRRQTDQQRMPADPAEFLSMIRVHNSS